MNLSAEDPDRNLFFNYRYGRFGIPYICFEDDSQELAALCSAKKEDLGDEPDGSGAPIPADGGNLIQDPAGSPGGVGGGVIVYQSAASTCTLPCGDSSVSYISPAGSFSSVESQAAANALGAAFACAVASQMCSGPPPTVFTSISVTCNFTCADGSTAVYVLAAGAFSAVDQLTADVQAHQLACTIAALKCQAAFEGQGPGATPPPGGGPNGTLIPVPPGVPPPGTTGPGSNTPLTPEEVTPFAAIFSSAAQTCAVACPGGGNYTFSTPAGQFFGLSAAQANAQAASFCALKAMQNRICLGSIEPKMCIGEAYNSTITATGGTVSSWAITSGSIPPGLVFNNGNIAGTSTTPGIYAFVVRATDINGNYAQRTYSIAIVEITTAASLPTGMVGIPYSKQLVQVGGTAPISWQIESGQLPQGLALDESTGLLSGEPPDLINGLPNPGGTFAFTVTIQDEST